MGRPPRLPGELTCIKFFMLVAPSEYLEIRDAAEEAGESMSEYTRVALAQRFNREHPQRLPFGQRFR